MLSKNITSWYASRHFTSSCDTVPQLNDILQTQFTEERVARN